MSSLHLPAAQAKQPLLDIKGLLYQGLYNDCYISINNSPEQTFHLQILCKYFVYFESFVQWNEKKLPVIKEKKLKLTIPLFKFIPNESHMTKCRSDAYDKIFSKNKIRRVEEKAQYIMMSGNDEEVYDDLQRNNLLLKALKDFIYLGLDESRLIPLEIFLPFCQLLHFLGYKGWEEVPERKTKSPTITDTNLHR